MIVMQPSWEWISAVRADFISLNLNAMSQLQSRDMMGLHQKLQNLKYPLRDDANGDTQWSLKRGKNEPQRAQPLSFNTDIDHADTSIGFGECVNKKSEYSEKNYEEVIALHGQPPVFDNRRIMFKRDDVAARLQHYSNPFESSV